MDRTPAKIYMKPGDCFVTTAEVTLVTEDKPDICWDSAQDLAGYQNPYDVADNKVGEFTSFEGSEPNVTAVINNVYRDATDDRFYYNETGE